MEEQPAKEQPAKEQPAKEQPSFVEKNGPTLIAGLVVVLVLVFSVVFANAHKQRTSDETSAATSEFSVLVHDGEGHTHEFPLADDGRYLIETELGSNAITVQNGRVWVSEADCPNGDCLRQNPLETPGPQLICLPHRLWVEIVPAGSTGGELDEASVSPTPDDIDVVAR